MFNNERSLVSSSCPPHSASSLLLPFATTLSSFTSVNLIVVLELSGWSGEAEGKEVELSMGKASGWTMEHHMLRGDSTIVLYITLFHPKTLILFCIIIS